MSQKSVKETVVELAIVKKVMAILGLDDAGKINQFYKKLIKEDERFIAQLEANKKAEKLQYDMDLSELEEKLEDAEEALEAAYLNVKPENVQTNADIADYSVQYRKNIEKATFNVACYTEAIKQLTEKFNKSIEDKNEQISKRIMFIDKISK